MPDVFISYSTKDEVRANEIFQGLKKVGVDVFMAGFSLQPGAVWKEEILKNLRAADIVLFIASPNSIASDAVKHELGGALFGSKEIYSICVDIMPTELPAWIQGRQAVVIGPESAEKLKEILGQVEKRVKTTNFQKLMVLMAAIGVLIYIAVTSKSTKVK